MGTLPPQISNPGGGGGFENLAIKRKSQGGPVFEDLTEKQLRGMQGQVQII